MVDRNICLVVFAHCSNTRIVCGARAAHSFMDDREDVLDSMIPLRDAGEMGTLILFTAGSAPKPQSLTRYQRKFHVMDSWLAFDKWLHDLYDVHP